MQPTTPHRASALAFKRAWVRACRHAVLAAILAVVLALVADSSALGGKGTHAFGKCAWIAVMFFTIAFVVTSARDNPADY